MVPGGAAVCEYALYIIFVKLRHLLKTLHPQFDNLLIFMSEKKKKKSSLYIVINKMPNRDNTINNI